MSKMFCYLLFEFSRNVYKIDSIQVGFVQIEVVNEYVGNQDEHHGTVWIIED